jgi:hypothetical protein
MAGLDRRVEEIHTIRRLAGTSALALRRHTLGARAEQLRGCHRSIDDEARQIFRQVMAYATWIKNSGKRARAMREPGLVEKRLTG